MYHRSLSADFSGATFYHVTMQQNLPGIAAHGLNPFQGGSTTGMAINVGVPEFVQQSRGRVYLTASWVTVKFYLNLSFQRLQDRGILRHNQYPAVLRIRLPDSVRRTLREDPDSGARLSYFLTEPVLSSCIDVAVSLSDATQLSIAGRTLDGEIVGWAEFVTSDAVQWVPLPLLPSRYGRLTRYYPYTGPSEDSAFTGR